jgi:hypothetical protein
VRLAATGAFFCLNWVSRPRISEDSDGLSAQGFAAQPFADTKMLIGIIVSLLQLLFGRVIVGTARDLRYGLIRFLTAPPDSMERCAKKGFIPNIE